MNLIRYISNQIPLIVIALNFLTHSQYIGWQQIMHPNGYSFDDIIISPHNNYYYLLVKNSKLFRSTDEGVTWSQSFPSISNPRQMVAGFNGNLFVVTNDGQKLYRSTNHGVTWSIVLSTTKMIRDLFVDSRNFVWLAQDSTVLKSTDSGTTWQIVLSNQLQNYRIRVNKLNYAYVASSQGGLSISKDDGTTWTVVFPATLLSSCSEIQFDSNNSVYAVLNGKIYFSSDHGTTWSLRLNEPILALAFSEANNKVYFLWDKVISGEIYVSSDTLTSSRYCGVDDAKVIKVENNYAFMLNKSSKFFRGHLDSIEFTPGNHFPLTIGNKWQYAYHLRVANPYVWEIRGDSLIDEKIYHKLYRNENFILVRYDPAEDIIFIRDSTQDSVNINMNLNSGTVFQSKLFFGGVKNSTMLPPYLFYFDSYPRKATRYYYTFNMATYWENHRFVYVDSLGLGGYFFSVSGPGGGSGGYELLLTRAIIHHPDTTIYYSDGRKPIFHITPKLTTNSLLPDSLKFFIDHYFSHYNNFTQSYVNFIDTVLFESYYSKNDSVINNPTIGARFSPPFSYTVYFDLVDTLIFSGFDFYYRLKAIDKGIIPEHNFTPDEGYYKLVFTTNILNDQQMRERFSLDQNYPNPFNPVTKIKYSIPSSTDYQSVQRVMLKVYDILGREVATLVDEKLSAGEYEVEFNANNLPSGIYIYQLTSGSFNSTKKFVLMK